MASIMKRGDSYSVRYKYKDHSGKPCEGWESFKTRKEAQERKITVEKELLDGTFLEKFYATLAKTPCGQYVHGVKQTLTDKQKKRLLSSTSIHEVHTLLKTAFSYAVEWDLIHKIPLPRDAPKVNIEERTIWDEKTMLAALQTIENPALHLAVHLSMILPGQARGLQVLSHSEKAQDQEIQPCPVYDQALEGRTAGVAGKAEAGRAPVGADREDRSKLLFPRPDPGSTPAPAK